MFETFQVSINARIKAAASIVAIFIGFTMYFQQAALESMFEMQPALKQLRAIKGELQLLKATPVYETRLKSFNLMVE